MTDTPFVSKQITNLPFEQPVDGNSEIYLVIINPAGDSISNLRYVQSYRRRYYTTTVN